MVLYDLFWGIGEAGENLLSIYDDNVFLTSFFNTTALLIGFFGLFYWLRHQVKFNEKAKNDPNQLK